MGYRSTVYFQFPKEQESAFLNAVKNNLKETTVDEALKFLDDIRQDQFTDACVYYDGYIKWYEDDDLIAAIMSALEEIEGENYGFVRYGEDPDDIEYLGCGDIDYMRDRVCLATMDAVNTATCVLGEIELATPEVKAYAAKQLRKILDKLQDFDEEALMGGVNSLGTPDGFDE